MFFVRLQRHDIFEATPSINVISNLELHQRCAVYYDTTFPDILPIHSNLIRKAEHRLAPVPRPVRHVALGSRPDPTGGPHAHQPRRRQHDKRHGAVASSIG